MVGTVVNKYQITSRLGRGGMGTVYRALDVTLNRDVAIKVLNAEITDQDVAKRFRAEAITVARLSHQGIATVYEFFEHEKQWLMVMEFVPGETFERLVERLGPLPVSRAAELTMQALSALDHAHIQQVVHRDLKPANLMINASGIVKVMDFGIARVAGTEKLTSAGFMMGTPAFMAPEQVTGDAIDGRTDIYAMGIVLYHLITARLPFDGDSPVALARARVEGPFTPVRTVRENVPDWLEEVLNRALAKDPAVRFQTAEEFRTALDRSMATVAAADSPSVSMDSSETMLAPVLTPVAAAAASGAALVGPAGAASAVAPMAAIAGPGTTPALTGAPVESRRAKSPLVFLGPLALVAVLVAAVAVMWSRGRPGQVPSDPAATAVTSALPSPTPEASPSTASAAASTAAPLSAAPSSPGSASTSGAGPSPSAGSGPGAPSGATTATTPGAGSPLNTPPGVTPPKPAAATPSAAKTTAAANAAAASAAAANLKATTPEVPDTTPLIAFGDVKLILVKGNKASEEDAVINFVAGQVSMTPKKGGPALAALPLKQLSHATYTHAKDPAWDSALAAPPAGVDYPGLRRSIRHWLVLQSSSAFLIVRLEDANWKAVIETFEARSGLKVDHRN